MGHSILRTHFCFPKICGQLPFPQSLSQCVLWPHVWEALVAEFDSLQAELAEFSKDPFRFVSFPASPAPLRVVRSLTLLDEFDRHAEAPLSVPYVSTSRARTLRRI